MSPTTKTVPKLENSKPTGMIYHHTISNKNSKLLVKHNVSMIHSHKKETVQILRSAKDGLYL